MTNYRIVAAVLLLVLSWGCAKKTALFEGNQVMESFTPSATQFGYLQAKAKLVLEEHSGKITRGTLQLRTKKDSLIWFSLSPGLGVEAIRGLLSQEKIQIQDRLGKGDVNMTYPEFEKRFGVKLSLGLFQNLLWADIPYPAGFEDRLVRVGKKFELTQIRDKVRYFSKIDTRHGKVTELSSSSIAGQGSILASFPKFQNIQSQVFPTETLVKVALEDPLGPQNFRIYLNWTTLDPQASPLTFPFRF
ncbi:MAG: DUF4292 domain-containing protein [Bacteroidetes bacterium]|nr:DUF4292 domain-containing protein [Bacteroidota bacterium]